MHLMQRQPLGEQPMTVDISRIPCTQAKPTAVAVFLFHDHHRIILRSDLSVTCETCSVPATCARAVAFMFENGVIRMTYDGATLKRI